MNTVTDEVNSTELESSSTQPAENVKQLPRKRNREFPKVWDCPEYQLDELDRLFDNFVAKAELDVTLPRQPGKKKDGTPHDWEQFQNADGVTYMMIKAEFYGKPDYDLTKIMPRCWGAQNSMQKVRQYDREAKKMVSIPDSEQIGKEIPILLYSRHDFALVLNKLLDEQQRIRDERYKAETEYNRKLVGMLYLETKSPTPIKP